MIKSTSSLAPSLDLRFNTAFTPGAALHLCCMLAARLFLSLSFMTLSLDLKERNEKQADEAHCRGKPKERSVWLVWIMRVVASRRRFLGNTCENRRAGTETDCNCELDGCLENGAGYGLLRLRQGGYDVHL
jgi:hypothetical protein